jgi:hypothetical protein
MKPSTLGRQATTDTDAWAVRDVAKVFDGQCYAVPRRSATGYGRGAVRYCTACRRQESWCLTANCLPIHGPSIPPPL